MSSSSSESRKHLYFGWVAVCSVLVVVSGIPVMALGGSAVTDHYVPHIVGSMFLAIPVGVFAVFGALASWPKGDAAMWDASPRAARVAASTVVDMQGRSALQLALDVPFALGDVRRIETTVADHPQRRHLAHVGGTIWVRVHPDEPSRLVVDWEETMKHVVARPTPAAQAIAATVLCCRSCGAELQGVAGLSSVVCQYCQTENHVVRS